MNLAFHKYESIGNDFVLLEEDDVRSWCGCEPDTALLSKLAIELCDRKFGIGGDGLLTYRWDEGKVHMRMFNPDGTEDFCGNGLRCAALHAKRLGSADKSVDLVHREESVHAAFTMGGWIDVGLPKPDFSPDSVPLADGVGEVYQREMSLASQGLNRAVVVTSVNVGSTHTVLEAEGPPSENDFQALGPAIERHKWFPDRTSVIWVWQREGRFNGFEIRIWERGVGETLGCGTGSAAAAAVIFRGRPLVAAEIKNPGGECAVALGPEGTMTTSAKARHVFSGETLPGFPRGILADARDAS